MMESLIERGKSVSPKSEEKAPKEIDFIISDADKAQYDQVFKTADINKDNLVDQEEAFFLKHSKLPRPVLAKIWKLSDTDKDNALNRAEFRIAMHLVHSCLKGCSLPSEVSPQLVASASSSIGQRSRNRNSASLSESNGAMQKDSEGNDFQNAARSMKAAYALLEKGQHKEALIFVEKALSVLKSLPNKQKELEVAGNYQAALLLLLEIKSCDELNQSDYAAIFARFLAEIIIQPKHRIICMRMAINRNMQMRNYGIASRFLLELLPLHPIDAKTLESKLTICQENNYQNFSLLNYTCERCKSTSLSSAKVCQYCFAPIDYQFFVVLRKKNLTKAQRSQLEKENSMKDASVEELLAGVTTPPTKKSNPEKMRESSKDLRNSSKDLPNETSRESTRDLRESSKDLRNSSKDVPNESREASKETKKSKRESKELRDSSKELRESSKDARDSTLELRESAREFRPIRRERSGSLPDRPNREELLQSLPPSDKIAPATTAAAESIRRGGYHPNLNLKANDFRKNLEEHISKNYGNKAPKAIPEGKLAARTSVAETKSSKKEAKSSTPILPATSPTSSAKEVLEDVFRNSFGGDARSSPLDNPKSKREQAVKELLATEKTYVKSLDILVNLYLKPIQALQDSHHIDRQNVRDIFSVIEVIHNYNSLFLSRIEERINAWSDTQKLGDIFIGLGDFMKMYTMYVNNYSLAIVTVAEVRQKSEKFADILEGNRKQYNNLDLQSLLIQPIQRLPRYVLLINEIISHTPEDHPDYQNLTKALEKTKSIAEYINDKKRESENMNAVLQVQDQILFPSGVNEQLIQPSRRFVRKANLKEVLPDGTLKNRTCFLFNDIVIVTRSSHMNALKGSKMRESRGGMSAVDEGFIYRYKYKISLGQCAVSEVLDPVDIEDPTIPLSNMLELNINREGKIVWVAASTAERDEWIGDIAKQIQGLAHKERTFTAPKSESSARIEQKVAPTLPKVASAPTNAAPPTKVLASSSSTNRVESSEGTSISPVNSGSSMDWSLQKSEWDFLFASSEEMTFQIGQMIEDIGKLFRIVEGKVASVCKTDRGDVVEQLTIGPGSIFGYRSILRKASFAENSTFSPAGRDSHHVTWREMHLVLSDKLRLETVDLDRLARLLRVKPEISWKFHKHMAVEFSRTMTALETSVKPKSTKISLKRSEDQENYKFKRNFPFVVETVLREFVVDYKSLFAAYRGTLYITPKHLCFLSQIFGLNQKSLISIESIVGIDRTSPTIVTISKNKYKSPDPVKCTMANSAEADEFYRILKNLWASQHQENNSSAPSKDNSVAAKVLGIEQKMKIDEMGKRTFDAQLIDANSLQEDWKMILKGAEFMRFRRGEVILKEGSKHAALFQVTRGNCIASKESKTLGVVAEGEIFGEIDFMEGEGASADVMADSDNVEVWKVSRRSLNSLFGSYPELAVRFFKYLAIVIEKRLYYREKAFVLAFEKKRTGSEALKEDEDVEMDSEEEALSKPYENPFEDEE